MHHPVYFLRNSLENMQARVKMTLLPLVTRGARAGGVLRAAELLQLLCRARPLSTSPLGVSLRALSASAGTLRAKASSSKSSWSPRAAAWITAALIAAASAPKPAAG